VKPLACALALLAASPAAALSVLPDCGPAEATIAFSFQQFDGFGNEVVMVVGHFRKGAMIDEEIYGYDDELANRRFSGSFFGKSATVTGFDAPFSARVIIEQRCEGDSCLPAFDGAEWLVFLEKTDEGYRFLMDEYYCGPSGFRNPSAADLDLAIDCLNGGCR
jgi:hypothetical protein